MTETTGERVSATVEAGAGRPFRFSLVLGEGRGRLLSWLGARWALGVGAVAILLFGAVGAFASALLARGEVATEAFVFASAGLGSLLVALHLRPRTVLFERKDGTWCWKERWVPRPGWSRITEERPLRLEREVLATVEGFTLYAGTRRLLSYLGDPSIGRSVSRAFRGAGVPLETVMKRASRDEE